MRVFSAVLAASLVATPVIALSVHDNAHARTHAHREIALEHRSQLHKRFDNARFTYYDITVGETSCEGFYAASDFVVALNSAQYGTYWKSPHCGGSITISYGGKTAQATIVDECPGCPYGGLDLTEGLFSYFASTDKGVLSGTWSFGGGGGDDSDPPKTTAKPDPPKTTKQPDPPKPTTTSQPPPKPKTTSHSSSPKPSTTASPTPSTTSTTSSTTASSASTTTSSAAPTTTTSEALLNTTGLVSGLVVFPTGVPNTVAANAPGNLLKINEAIINFGGLVVAGSKAQ